MTTELTENQIGIMHHTKYRASVPGAYCGDSPDMQVLVRLGLMKSLGKVSWCPDEYFGLTTEGHEKLRELNVVRA